MPRVPGWLAACMLAAASCAVAPVARSETPSPLQAGHAAARALTDLFVRTCLPHAGHADTLRAALVPPGYQRAPERLADRLLGRPGQAFQVPGAPGHLMVLSFDDGWCGNGGTDIEPHALTMMLSQAARAEGLSMRLMGAGQDGNEQRYLLQATRPPHMSDAAMVLLVLLQPQPEGALMQASLFASRMPPEADAPTAPGGGR